MDLQSCQRPMKASQLAERPMSRLIGDCREYESFCWDDCASVCRSLERAGEIDPTAGRGARMARPDEEYSIGEELYVRVNGRGPRAER